MKPRKLELNIVAVEMAIEALDAFITDGANQHQEYYTQLESRTMEEIRKKLINLKGSMEKKMELDGKVKLLPVEIAAVYKAIRSYQHQELDHTTIYALDIFESMVHPNMATPIKPTLRLK